MGFHPYTYAVFGMLADKDIDAVVRHLARRVDHWFCCALEGPRALTAEALADKVRAVLAGMEDPDVRKAGVSTHEPDDRIVVFGSFLTVSGVLQSLKRA